MMPPCPDRNDVRMIVDQNPVIQHRRLRETLRDARLRRDLTQKQVAAALDWSRTKLVRIENGTVHISTTDLRALLDHYGIHDPQLVDRLIGMARAAKSQPWAELPGVLPPGHQRYLAYEAAAKQVQSAQLEFVPGQLQTEQYAGATIETLSPDGHNPVAVQRLVAARRNRQELLAREDAPHMQFILAEGVLLRAVGGPEAMAAQVEHLRHMARHPRVEIRVIANHVGAHPGQIGAFVVLGFDDPRDDLVYMDDQRGALTPSESDHRDVAVYKEIFAKLTEISVSGPELDAALDDALTYLTTMAKRQRLPTDVSGAAPRGTPLRWSAVR